jgi:hypothetical protein
MLKYCQALVAHACNPSYLEGWDQEDEGSKVSQTKSSQECISKITRAKWTGSVAKVVEHLLCKCEALSSNPSINNNNNKKGKKILNSKPSNDW